MKLDDNYVMEQGRPFKKDKTLVFSAYVRSLSVYNLHVN